MTAQEARLKANQNGGGVHGPAFKPLQIWKGLRKKAKVSNRTREIWPSGIIGGASGNVSHGETVNPSCNRKSRNGNPSPTAGRARFLSQCSSLLYLCYETRRSHKPIAAARSRLKAVRRRTSLSV